MTVRQVKTEPANKGVSGSWGPRLCGGAEAAAWAYLPRILWCPACETLTWFSNRQLQCLFSLWFGLNDNRALRSGKKANTHTRTCTNSHSEKVPLAPTLNFHQKIQTISMSSVLISRSFFSCSAFWRQKSFLKFEVTDSVQGESFNSARLQVNSNKQVNSIRRGASSAHSTIKANVFLPP